MSLGDSLHYANGDVIFEEGSLGEDVYIIKSGKVEVSQRVGDDNIPIASLEEGDFFGEAAPLTGEPRSATITAVTDLSLRKRSLDDMFRDMENDRQFMVNVCLRLANRLKDANYQVRTLILRSRGADEIDPRGPMVSYLRDKTREKDKQIENLRKQIELSERRAARRPYGLFWITGILSAAVLLVVVRELYALITRL